jgi:hypothetical protein
MTRSELISAMVAAQSECAREQQSIKDADAALKRAISDRSDAYGRLFVAKAVKRELEAELQRIEELVDA